MDEKLNLVSGLEITARNFGPDIYKVCSKYLNLEDFANWSGSAEPDHHHYGSGGLQRHTIEVVQLCLMIADYYEGYVDKAELFLSAFFHDLGKLYDYKIINECWQGVNHKRMIHHISRSFAIWTEESLAIPSIYEKYYEKVGHAILSHHGTRGRGSPVAPKSKVAWILHLCDGISARMDDADKMDVVKGYFSS